MFPQMNPMMMQLLQARLGQGMAGGAPPMGGQASQINPMMLALMQGRMPQPAATGMPGAPPFMTMPPPATPPPPGQAMTGMQGNAPGTAPMGMPNPAMAGTMQQYGLNPQMMQQMGRSPIF